MEQQEVCAAVEQYGSTVYRLALAQTHSQADADDVYQEVFLRYVRAAPAFATEEHRKAWLLRVTINCCKKLQGSFCQRPFQPEPRERGSCWSYWRLCRRNTGP